MRVLGIESSCDETGIALFDGRKGLLAHVLHSQVALHQLYGGVVPELASRDHVKYLIPLLTEVLNQATLYKTDIDAVAYTAGPGLIGALLTGACFAKSLAFGLQIPAIAVHHLEAHILAAMLDSPDLCFPFLALLVSGGHTQLIVAEALGQYTMIGETLDDAVGEAFDKTAKLMGIPYPGGPLLAKYADEYRVDDSPYPPFPKPMTDKPGLDFSFSGLKTHALTTWKKTDQSEKAKKVIAKAFQHAVVDTLVIKCTRALKQTGLNQLVVAGGVGANRALRHALNIAVTACAGTVYFPRPDYCTDNGVMVAYAGYLHLNQGKRDKDHAIVVKARWPLSDNH